MADFITIDATDLNKGLARLEKEMGRVNKKGLSDVAEEIMRLSSREVPHDTGQLQNSGQVDPEGEGFIIGYNKLYAARLHEHPEYNFQNGRKGKYLEDPIKNNTAILLEHYKKALTEIF